MKGTPTTGWFASLRFTYCFSRMTATTALHGELTSPITTLATNATNTTGESSPLYTATVRRALVIATVVPASIEAILCFLVIYAAFRVKAYRSSLNFLVVNAAAADLLRGIHGVVAPSLFYDLLEYTDVNQRLCVCYMWIHIMQYCWSMWSIALIAFSRYDAVCRPFHRVLTLKGAVFAVCVVLLEAILFACLPLMGWNSYGLLPLRPNSPKYRCSVSDNSLSVGHKAFLPVFYVVNYLLPLIVIVICYGRIIPIALRHKRQQAIVNSPSLVFTSQSSPPTKAKSGHSLPGAMFSAARCELKKTRIVSNPNSDRMGALDVIKSKVFCYMTIIVLSNVVFTTPFAVAEVLRFLDIVDVNILLFPVFKLIFTLNFVINSCFYVLWVRDFRNGLLNTLGCASLLRRRRYRKSISASRVSGIKSSEERIADENTVDVSKNSTIKEDVHVQWYATSV